MFLKEIEIVVGEPGGTGARLHRCGTQPGDLRVVPQLLLLKPAHPHPRPIDHGADRHCVRNGNDRGPAAEDLAIAPNALARACTFALVCVANRNSGACTRSCLSSS